MGRYSNIITQGGTGEHRRIQQIKKITQDSTGEQRSTHDNKREHKKKHEITR